ncbi:MAG TPA: protoglobin domain-containing protein [Candidatus Obscuribacterales bacterium]
MDNPRYAAQDATWSQQLSDRTIELRKAWLNFSEEDEALVREVDPLVRENVDPMIDDMYAHFLSFPQTRAFFPNDDTLKRAQTAQKQYFLRLTQGNYDVDYVSQRLVVGNTHYRIGLDPTWYLGAYNRVMTWLRQLVFEKYKHDPEKFLKIISALTRLIFFDMGLAIESYSIAKERAIRAQQDEIARLEADSRTTKSIVENAPIGIIRLDAQLVCVECNAEFAEMLDLSREDLVGKPLPQMVPHLDATPLRQVFENGHPFRRNAEKLDLSMDGSSAAHYYDWAAWPLKHEDGNISGLLAVFTDATNRVLLQQQREDFVATLTHDLKTPILAANRAIKLLMDGDFGKVEEQQAKILETISQSNEALYQLVQTLLDVYRYESGAKQLSFTNQNLAELISKKVEELRPLAAGRELSVSAELPARANPVMCDIDEIRRVIQNLLDNALKFTPPGGTITVKLEQTNDITRISVIDTGKGISETDKPKLFQRFWAAASSGRYYASTGLGLFLCRKIVESHGGRIGCESVVGKGSTFYFTIDSAETRRKAQHQTASED